MIISSFLQYQDMSLQALADKLGKYYYELIDIVIKYSKKYFQDSGEKAHSDTCNDYSKQCQGLIEDIEKYLNNRINVFIPYINELVKKDTDNHDCANCTGNCSMQHTASLMNFTESLGEVKELELRLRTVLQLGEHNCLEFKPVYNKLMLLQGLLHEVVYIEENILLQKIKAAQKNIHATS